MKTQYEMKATIMAVKEALNDFGYKHFVIAIAEENGENVRQMALTEGRADYVADLLVEVIDNAPEEVRANMAQITLKDILGKMIEKAGENEAE